MGDETRWAALRKPAASFDSLPTAPDSAFANGMLDEEIARYRAALERLDPGDRQLVVASLELGYTCEQIALVTGRKALAARASIRRALLHLAAEMESG